MWRSLLKDLPQGDRAGHVRRQGSIVTIDLEALTRKRRRLLSVDTTVAAMSMHPPSGGPKAHEFISGTDCYGEIERGELMIASQSGVM